MPDYFHSALRGDQIHEAKVKILPAGSPVPVPEWEGQMLVIGLNFYYAATQNGVLTWIQPTASNEPNLPSDVVKFEVSISDPLPRAGSGVIHVNNQTQNAWFLSRNNWIKLGTGSNKTFEIISGRSGNLYSGNFFELADPVDSSLENCLVVKKWEVNKKYYLAIKCPSISFLGGADDNNYYLELWRGYAQLTISSHLQGESLSFLDTILFIPETEVFRLGMYIRRNSQKVYLNFRFNEDERLIDIREIASFYYYG